jgi:hypothetical protein
MMRAAAIAFCVALVVPAGAAAQPAASTHAPAAAGPESAPPGSGSPSTSPWLRFDDPGPFEALFTWYPPLLIRNGIDLKDFIRSDAFAAYRRFAGDARAADAIYVRAMSLTANNTAVALLIATVATFDHYVVGVRVPLLNLWFPLSNESREEFDARVRNLPSKLYADSPPGPRGDRDKLQHFFGSAFIALAFESQGAARRVGDFIEVGEDAAIVDGVNDARDERADWNGREFGAALMADNRLYPSGFFHTPIVGRTGDAGGSTNQPGKR